MLDPALYLTTAATFGQTSAQVVQQDNGFRAALALAKHHALRLTGGQTQRAGVSDSSEAPKSGALRDL